MTECNTLNVKLSNLQLSESKSRIGRSAFRQKWLQAEVTLGRSDFR